MQILIRKYGGSSLATAEAVQRAASQLVELKRQGHSVVAVVSAMGLHTDELVELSRQIHPDPPRRELDVLLSSAEHVSSALLAMAIQRLGEPSISLTGSQCGIITNDVHSNARILEIRPHRIRQELEKGRIVVAAGFQGVGQNGETTTLGRGGSDTTAVALAAALGAQECQISTDVEGVYSADPRIAPQAQRLQRLGSGEMQELAWHGAQVVKAEAVEFAHSNAVSFQVRSTFGGAQTQIDCQTGPGPSEEDVYVPRRPAVAGVSGRKDLVRIRLRGAVLDSLASQRLFDDLAGYDLISGHLDSCGRGADLFLSTLEMPHPSNWKAGLEERLDGHLEVTLGLGAVTVVGFGIGSRPASLYQAGLLLNKASSEVLHTFSSRQSISYVLPADQVDDSVRLLHRHFIENESLQDPLAPPSA